MSIQNVSLNTHANSFVSPVANNASVPAANKVQTSPDPQVSATVTLSAQGQKQSQPSPTQARQSQTSQSQSGQTQTLNTVNTPATPNAVPQSKETNAAPGIQFMAGESKGGRVNTYA
jgi:hypothetical protein